QQGDEVLKQVAVALQGAVRVEDFVARYGGEEFILLLPDTAGESVKLAAERVRAAVENNRVKHLTNPGETLQVTASFGGVSVNPAAFKTDLDLTSIIEIADQNMYEAKKGGRNRVVVSALNKAS
ncbi:MAG: GGDEF domain-containing protein, partial [Bdellovibrionia bacterium]